jgi:hypothetical protein
MIDDGLLHCIISPMCEGHGEVGALRPRHHPDFGRRKLCKYHSALSGIISGIWKLLSPDATFYLSKILQFRLVVFRSIFRCLR